MMFVLVLSKVPLHMKKFVAFPHKPFNFLCYPWEALLYSKPFNRNKLSLAFIASSFRVTEENLVFETVQSGPYSSFECFLCS